MGHLPDLPLSDLPLSDLTIDESLRPKAPDLGPLTPVQARAGRQLAAIHRHHLRDMTRITMVLDRIEAGDSPPAELTQIVLASDMAQNFRAVGTLCGQECRMLTFHHDAEEQGIFPQLEAQGVSGLSAVVARLRAEHEIVHELLDRLTNAAQALETKPTEANFQTARDVFHQLTKVVAGHFHYEETELRDALGRFVPHL